RYKAEWRNSEGGDARVRARKDKARESAAKNTPKTVTAREGPYQMIRSKCLKERKKIRRRLASMFRRLMPEDDPPRAGPDDDEALDDDTPPPFDLDDDEEAAHWCPAPVSCTRRAAGRPVPYLSTMDR